MANAIESPESNCHQILSAMNGRQNLIIPKGLSAISRLDFSKICSKFHFFGGDPPAGTDKVTASVAGIARLRISGPGPSR